MSSTTPLIVSNLTVTNLPTFAVVMTNGQSTLIGTQLSAGQLVIGTGVTSVPIAAIPTGTLGEVVVTAAAGLLNVALPSSIQLASPSTYNTGTCSTGGVPNTVLICSGTTFTAAMAFGTFYVGTTIGTTSTAFITQVINSTALMLGTAVTIPASTGFSISYGGAQFAGANAGIAGPLYVGSGQTLGLLNSPQSLNIFGAADSAGWNIYGTQLYPQIGATFLSASSLTFNMGTYTDSSGFTRYSSTGNVGFRLATSSVGLFVESFASGTVGNQVSGQVNPAIFTQSGIEAPTISTNTMVYSGASNLLSGLVVPAGLIPTTNGGAPIAAPMVGSQVRSFGLLLLPSHGRRALPLPGMARHGSLPIRIRPPRANALGVPRTARARQVRPPREL